MPMMTKDEQMQALFVAIKELRKATSNYNEWQIRRMTVEEYDKLEQARIRAQNAIGGWN